jgi:hypothetical protein
MSIRRVGGGFAQRVPENEVVHRRQQRDFLFRGHRRFSQRFQTLLHMAHRIAPGGSRQHRHERPGMANEDSMGVFGDLHHGAPPVSRK